jgi:hydrogenase expression/formation protein HypE
MSLDLECPIPLRGYDHVVLGHGSGGRLSAELVARVFVPAFGYPPSRPLEDQAVLDMNASRVAFTTDSFVVRPLFFPGGDIGRLAVNGTVNDLAVGGARARFLSAAFILEEGVAIADLERIALSMKEACSAAGVALVTGDTKVIERRHGRTSPGEVFITTSGVGVMLDDKRRSIADARPGDSVIVSGTLGDHGVAVMSVREGLELETSIVSDTAALGDLVGVILRACPDVRCMRDPTRGGLASTLNELAIGSRAGVAIVEERVPVKSEVRAACEILGLDPHYVANEGKLVCIVPEADTARVLDVMRAHPLGRDAAAIGRVTDEHPGIVTLKTRAGATRVVALLAGEQLPRIC